jgi:hypothetical protein
MRKAGIATGLSTKRQMAPPDRVPHDGRPGRGRSGHAQKTHITPYTGNEDEMMKNVEFAMILVMLLIAAAVTGTFLPSPTVSEMQVREASFGAQANVSVGLLSAISSATISQRQLTRIAKADTSSQSD